MSRPFIDYVNITARGGTGGDGCTSFKSQPYQPRGGPDGGNGGKGGDVILLASHEKNTLNDLNYEAELSAENGTNGGPNNRQGAQGNDLIVEVPVGTIARDSKTGQFLGELTDKDEKLVVARGGKGGRGNHCFTNSRRQRPRFHELGEPGETVELELELKLLADVGLIGIPNAGKSTLLSKLTRAHPRIGAHPFTTLHPNLGVLSRDYKDIVLCDIPGLIENAHQGAGLGIDFLRHIDRTEILLHVVDMSGRDPVGEFHTIRKELESYSPKLLDKPTIIACNKMDVEEPEIIKLFKEEISPAPGSVIGISALEGTGLDKLVEKLWDIFENLKLEEEKEVKQTREPERLIKMEQKAPIKVTPVGERFLLQGDEVVELIRRFDLNNAEALSYVREKLIDLGLHRKLEKAGCRPGDTVQIGNQEFEYTG